MNCAYLKCECLAGSGPELDDRRYCSAYCVDAELEPEKGCGCGHPECTAVREPVSVDYWANHP
jgi:hypothetical protein